MLRRWREEIAATLAVGASIHAGGPLTGKPDAGDLLVRFGGRGDREQAVFPTPIDNFGELGEMVIGVAAGTC